MAGQRNGKQIIQLLCVLCVLALSAFACDNGSSDNSKSASHKPDQVTPVGADVCTSCHTTPTDTWMTSAHGNAGGSPADLDSSGYPAYNDFATTYCATCHDPLGDGLDLVLNLTGNVDRPVIGCESCHGGGSEHLGDEEIPVPSPSLETCLKCHGSRHATFTRHAIVPGDTILNTGAGAQAVYFVDNTKPRPCAQCHGWGHNVDKTIEINKQYARSGHGAPLAEAWVHYDWKHSSRQSCQRCHTTTGFKNYADSLAAGTTYVPANNDFSYLVGNDDPNPIVNDNDQKETLYCSGCHIPDAGSEFTGVLRDPGAYPLPYAVFNGATAFPDLNGSNVCIACHSGRESGKNIGNLAGDSVAYWSNKSFVNSHYLAAAGIMYDMIGYEYPSMDYADWGLDMHHDIGTPATTGSGSNGPCVGCHMTSHDNNEKHLFEAAEMKGNALRAVTSACDECHGGGTGWDDWYLNDARHQYEGALVAFSAVLKTKGYYFGACHPYFYKTQAGADACTSTLAVKNWLSAADVTGSTGKKNMGAAFNYNLLKHDGGAFVHRPLYVRRLIYDSIDWLDDGSMNNSVATAINALSIDAVTKTDALNYLWGAGGRP